MIALVGSMLLLVSLWVGAWAQDYFKAQDWRVIPLTITVCAAGIAGFAMMLIGLFT